MHDRRQENSDARRDTAGKRARKKHNTMLRCTLAFAISVVVLIALVLLPTPGRGKHSGISLYGENPNAVYYGPELPENTPEIMPAPVPDEVLLPDLEEDEQVTYVYAMEDQECYHLPTCKFAYASGHRFTVSEAQLLGYKPCNICNPPVS